MAIWMQILYVWMGHIVNLAFIAYSEQQQPVSEFSYTKYYLDIDIYFPPPPLT